MATIYVRSLKASIIGCGSIAEDHARILASAGITIDSLCTRTLSSRAKNFCCRFEIQNHFTDLNIFLSKLSAQQVLIVATPWNVTNSIFLHIPDTIPTLYEKPLFLNLQEFSHTYETASDTKLANTFIGFNRRFYPHIKELKDAIKNERDILIQGIFADPYTSLIKNFKDIKKVLPFYISAHWVDLLMYLMDDIVDKNEISISRLGTLGRTAVQLQNKRITIQASFIPDAPVRHTVNLFTEQEAYFFDSLEVLFKSKKIKREKDIQTGRNIYSPEYQKIADETKATLRPGLLGQLEEFIQTAVSPAPAKLAISKKRWARYQTLHKILDRF